MTISRRRFLARSAAAAVGAVAGAGLAEEARAFRVPRGPRSPRADDERHWARIAGCFDLTDAVINVENGNWGVMARPVLEAYVEHTRRVNRDNAFYARRAFYRDYLEVVEAVAGRLGAGPDEVALTRGATEALQNLIGGYRGLGPGAAVMYADLDYGAMQAAMEFVAAREGCEVIRLAVPEPATHEGLIDFYDAALEAHPATRLLLLTHVSHRTGLVLPVREITGLARTRGVDVIVDAAHSWGQLDFRVAELGADFVGFNLHKWMGAPIGVGAMYVRRARLRDIGLNISATPAEADRISGRVHSGTSNFAAFLAVPDAFAFHDFVGAEAKAARVRYLRGVWTSRVADVDGLQLLTPDDPRLHAGITSFRFAGRTSVEDNREVARRLLEDHRIFTVHRDGVAAGACVRVTPAIYNSADDLRAVAAALRAIAA